MTKLAERLRNLRKQHKLTQKDVADILGMSESGYGYYEQARNEPSISTLEKLADRYGVSLEYISGKTDIPTVSSSKIKEVDSEYFIKDPNLGLWFKEIKNAPEDKQEELKKIWDIIKVKEAGRNPGDKQGD